MNAIQHAINWTKARIPKEVLHEVFIAPTISENSWSRTHAPVVNVDHVLRDKVIEQLVLPTINLISGQRDHIPLDGLGIQYNVDYTQTFTIPKARTRGLSITTVFAILSGSAVGSTTGHANTSPQRSNGVIEALSAMRASRQPVPVVADQHIQIVGDNTILLRAPLRQYGFLFLDCMLENDSQLSHLPPAIWLPFGKLVLEATKMYIHTNAIIPVDQAEISGGMAIGTFRNVVDGYADAGTLFEEQVADWQVRNILADPLSHSEHVQGVLGGLFP